MTAVLALALTISQPAASLARETPQVTTRAILGIEVGMPIDQVRHLLAQHGAPESRPTREGGTKEVWRLTTTGFEWLAFKADKHGRVVWLTGHRRAGQAVSFDALGVAPNLATEDTAVWHSSGRFGPQRLTLRGRDRAAVVLTLSQVSAVIDP